MASSHTSTIHVLLLSYPAQGHINPLLQLGKRLATHRGVRCTLAVTRYVLGQSKPQTGAVHVAAYSDGCDTGGYEEAGDAEAYLSRLESAGSASLDELLRAESAGGRPVRAVVYDSFLMWAPRVARRHGAACAAFFTQACVVNVAYAHAWAGQMDLPVAPGKALPELPGLPAGLGTADFPTFLTEPDGGCLAYLDLVLQQCQGFEVADHVLVNSFYELEIKEAEYMASRWGAKTVGPTVPSAYLDNRLTDDVSYGFHLHTPMTEESKAWLDARLPRSVVYVSFGSLAAPSAGQMAEVAEGLDNSGKDFLWVVRASETSKIPGGFVDKVKGRGLLVTWSPQLEVLAHPAVGCFVTHCGWNSTMEALGIGVPMVAMPQWSDQPTNAKYIEHVWQVGVKLQPDAEGVVTKEEVERCVRQVMEGERSDEYKKNAAGWSEKAKKAMSEGGSSDSNIVEFLSKIRFK
ncbi:hypothetical protein GQ55_2G323300 [Panicum hallii var. hallii]|uniref:Glycosyltransferase n=1 Tax=Panicum hallii var. hallii TaxID=1504633 RepID=A0A2T7EUQ2_9POAL|nr:hypothetical protein GQ55_2G323300 [Panicum hallii var. hallii]